MEIFWHQLQNLTNPQAIISGGGFYVLLLVVFAETGLFFGFFLPGDYLLFLAGLFCANGMLPTPIYILVSSLIAAGFLGNLAGYAFGYRTGPMLFNRGDSFFFKKKYVFMAEDFYARYGGMALVLGRFFPIIRTFAPIFAGVVRLSFKKFIIFNLLGSVAWVSSFTMLGFFLGKRYPQLNDYLQYIILGLIFLTSLPLVWAFVGKRLKKP